jgi:cobalt-zinc-cadmium efflux system protein
MERRHRASCELALGSVRCLCNSHWLQVSLALGLLVVVIEALGSFHSGSLALLADGSHTLVDALFYAFAIYVQRRLYARPWEKEHKWEHRASKLNGTLFFLVAAGILFEALHRGTDTPVDTATMGWVAFASFVLNIGQYWVLKLGAQNRTNREVNAHNKADAFQSAVVCGAAWLSYWGVGIPASLVDIALSALLAIYFVYQGFEALKGEHNH